MLDDLITALDEAQLQFAHFAWSHAPEGDYGIYAEDNGEDLEADNKHIETGTQLWLHYFTRDASGSPRTTIEGILNTLGAPWYLNNTQYENDTGYIHYEWSVGILG